MKNTKYLETDLMPFGIKKFMKVVRIVATCYIIVVVAVYLESAISGFFSDWKAAILCALLFLVIAYPAARHLTYKKISQSTVRLYDDHLLVLTYKGKCWRKINYSQITSVKAEEIEDFFYNKNEIKFKYITLYLNGITDIPVISYRRLFSHKNFFAFGYNEEAYQYLYERILFNKASYEGEPQHYFCPTCNSDIKFGADKCDNCGELFDWSINK